MSDRPVSKFFGWSIEDLQEKLALIDECRETYGLEAARKKMEELGFPVPPRELIDPLPGEQRRH